MARTARLNVYVTPAGFYDAVVAAPNQKAALAAWGVQPPAPKRAKKIKWLFTLAGQPWFCLAGLWRPGAAGQPDAFALLTTEPGPDVAPYHARQVVVLEPEAWSAWLDGPEPKAVLQPSSAGALGASRAG